jgi:hypothetical protein
MAKQKKAEGPIESLDTVTIKKTDFYKLAYAMVTGRMPRGSAFAFQNQFMGLLGAKTREEVLAKWKEVEELVLKESGRLA